MLSFWMPAELSSDDLISLNRLTTVARTLAGTAHDLNNALQVISGSAELLMQQREISESTRRAAERINQQTARAANVLNELMQFARETQTVDTRLSLRTVALNAIALRAFGARRAGLALTFDDTPPSSAMVRGRSGQLLQVVLNLIMNAEQALAGKAGGRIVLSLQESATGVALTVADNGPGVPPELADRLFTPFVTTHPSPDTHGLGLAAARAIAQRHGGAVTLDSSADGCKATVSLPAAV